MIPDLEHRGLFFEFFGISHKHLIENYSYGFYIPIKFLIKSGIVYAMNSPQE